MKQTKLQTIRQQTETLAQELLAVAGLGAQAVLVLGCSSSELAGKRIGTAGNQELASAVLDGLWPLLEEQQIYLAVQCCEHLNRALVVERDCLERYQLEEVHAIPHPHAGGLTATLAWQRMQRPALAFSIAAHAGMDLGNTLIGMHLRRVAVPVRGSLKQIGEAPVVMACTRPMLIGGERARY